MKELRLIDATEFIYSVITPPNNPKTTVKNKIVFPVVVLSKFLENARYISISTRIIIKLIILTTLSVFSNSVILYLTN